MDDYQLKELFIGEFNQDSLVNFKEFIKETKDIGQALLPIHINSYGGESFVLLSMMNIIESSKVPVMTICDGFAMSSGALLLASGTRGYRYAHKDATIMLHQVSSGAEGTLNDIFQTYTSIKNLNSLISSKLDKYTKKKSGYWEKRLSDGKDLYLTSEECLSLGIIDYVGIPSIEVENSVRINIL